LYCRSGRAAEAARIAAPPPEAAALIDLPHSVKCLVSAEVSAWRTSPCEDRLNIWRNRGCLRLAPHHEQAENECANQDQTLAAITAVLSKASRGVHLKKRVEHWQMPILQIPLRSCVSIWSRSRLVRRGDSWPVHRRLVRRDRSVRAIAKAIRRRRRCVLRDQRVMTDCARACESLTCWPRRPPCRYATNRP